MVLAVSPPTPVVIDIDYHLAMIQAHKRWCACFGMAIAPDTDIGGASASEVVMFDFAGQLLPFTLDDGGEKSSIGLSIWAGGEYQEPLAPNWRLRVGGSIFRREYAGKQFDRMGLGFHAGPRWLIDPRTEASLLLTFRREWQGSRPSSRSAGVRLEASRRFTPRLSGQLGATWSKKRHDESTRSDGPVSDLSVGLTLSGRPTLQANFHTGWERARTEAETLRNRTLSLGARIALPCGFNVSETLTGRLTDF